jgi:hypothetical protein
MATGISCPPSGLGSEEAPGACGVNQDPSRVHGVLVKAKIVDMPSLNPVLIDMPMPIRKPRLLLRPKQIGDGANASAAIAETWDDFHRWMRWADDPAAFNPEMMEARTRQVMARFILREDVRLIGIAGFRGFGRATGYSSGVLHVSMIRFVWAI